MLIVHISIFLQDSIDMYSLGNVRYLRGQSADPLVLQRVTHIAYSHRPDVIEKMIQYKLFIMV